MIHQNRGKYPFKLITIKQDKMLRLPHFFISEDLGWEEE